MLGGNAVKIMSFLGYLSMLDALTFLNLAYGAATAVAPPIPVMVDETAIAPKALGETVQVRFYRHWLASDSDCKYFGLALPYARDWELIENEGQVYERRLPPEPNKIIGYAVVVDKKVCKDGVPQPVAYLGSTSGGWGGKIYEGSRVDISDLTKTPEANLPQWYPQVRKVLEALSKKQGAAER